MPDSKQPFYSDDEKRQWLLRWSKEVVGKELTHGKPVEPNWREYERPSGVILYTPHNCERPVANEVPLGTIWECRDYTKKSPDGNQRVCYDQWITEVVNNVVTWVLFKRSF